ncbi:MAG TPA: nicotinate-nucleotide--dimethylbenzimidazole phosphoribosyltransferase [Mycobacteriales bacterium]|nr:nicotinate-nucleotide--dimethylbenzimidazole phosphoribosyltransferase [Mycobacteriales bacterium]
MTHHDIPQRPVSLSTESLGSLMSWVTWARLARNPGDGAAAASVTPFTAVTAVTFGDPTALTAWDRLRPAGIQTLSAPTDDPPTDVIELLKAGASLADAAVDGGADLVIPVLAHSAASTHTAAAAAVCVLVPTEPGWALGFERRLAAAGEHDTAYLDDGRWMQRCRQVRDLSWRARTLGAEQLLAELGDPQFTILVGLLRQLAERTTPVLLDGAITAAAALVASRFNLFAPQSYFAPQRHGDAAERFALDALGLEPVADLGLRCGHGMGALILLPLLQTALAAAGSPDATSAAE